jgi:N-acetylmuramoyl-L-alanine amidase
MTRAIRIVLDPGHGGPASSKRNLGTVHGNVTLGPKGFAVDGDLVEKIITPEVVTITAHMLRHTPGFEVELTRYTDKRVSFAERRRIAKAFRADFFISIHVNANRSPSVRGAETYYLPGCSLGKLAAGVAADSMPRQLRSGRVIDAYDDPGTKKDDWIQNPISVLEIHPPSVLIEIGMASNAKDRAFLLDPYGLAECASAPYNAACAVARAIRKKAA